MGKSRHQKRHISGRNQPTGLPSVKETEAQMEQEENTDGVEINNTVLSLLEQIQSPTADERECACTTVASLVSQEGAIEQFMQGGIVKIIGPLLLDKNQRVQEICLGVLRNISVEGGYEVCETMVQQDVMTPLVALLNQITTPNIEENMEAPDSKKEVKVENTDVLLQAVHLLWNLCESSPTAVKVFNQSNLLKTLLPNIYNAGKGLPLALVSAQCVYALTDGNPEAVSIVISEGVISTYSNALAVQHSNNGELLLKTVIAGILNNIGPEGLNSAAGSILSSVVSLMSIVLEVNALSAIKHVVSMLEDIGKDELPPAEGAEDKKQAKHKEIGTLIEEIKYLLNAQQLAVEIIANLCCSQDDEEWEECEESSEGSSDELNGASSMEEDAQEGITDSSEYTGVPSEVREAFVKDSVMEKVLHLSEPVDLSFCSRCSSNKELNNIVSNMKNLQSRALLCLSNLISGLDITDLGGEPGLLQIWSGLSQLAISDSVKVKNDMLEAVTGALRAVVQKLNLINSPKLQEVTENDFEFLCQIVQQCKEPQIRVNSLRIVAGFGCALSKIQPVHPQLKNVGAFLIQVATNDPDIWVIAEALDSIFDVFAEDHTDPVVKETGIIDSLRSNMSQLKLKMKQQKKLRSDHMPVISTARANLVRFIKYKSA